MRFGPAVAAIAIAVMAAGAGAADAAPSSAFSLQTSKPCRAGSCRALLSYDPTGLSAPVKLEIDWDVRDEKAFQADAAIQCAPAPLDDPDYEPVPCEAASPVYRVPGKAAVALRVTDTVDGTQALGAQPIVIEPGSGREVGTPGGSTGDLCAPRQNGVQCGPGNGRKTAGGGEKVPHKGWPAVTGILWKVLDSAGHKKVGGPDNDELLGHHGSDRLLGREGHDILWGDWDPKNNNTRQKDVLDGGPGNDWIYPSHGPTVVKAGAGKDYVWAYYGRGTIDCGPGKDTARVKLNGPWKTRNCERILHFCAFGSDGHGGCLKPGEKRPGRARARAAWVAAHAAR